jgi:hypothetical protein
MKGSQKDRSECTKEEEKRQTFVRFEVRSLHCGVTSFRSSLPRVLFPHLTRPPFGNSFSVPQQEIAVQCIKGMQCTWRECSAVHQGSAAHTERVQCSAHEKSAVRCSAHQKLLRCTAKRAGDEERKKECSAVCQGSAVPTKRVQCSAHPKLLRCIAKRAGDEEGEWRER